MISVVIPNFNHGVFLAEAIRSALSQGAGELEVIVVDDGSTDDSREIAGGFGRRVRYIWQENKGLPGARNTGILAARGEYIALLDADDSWLPGFLPAVMAQWRSDPGLGAVHTGFQSIDRDGNRLPQTEVSTAHDGRMYDRLVDGEFFVPSAVVVRRECFDQVGLFDESLRGSEDWDMWLRVAREFRFAGIPRPLVNYRIHGSNMSGDPDYMLGYQLMVVAKHFGEADGPADQWPRERQRAYAAVYRFAAHGYFLRGDLAKSRVYLGRALAANPALCDDIDFFYELACADQPLGRRTAAARHDLQRNADFLISTLDDVFDDPDVPSRLAPRKRSAVGHAHLALGLLAYGGHDVAIARQHLSKALAAGPCVWSDGRLWSTLAKSAVSPRLLEASRARFGRGRTTDSRT